MNTAYLSTIEELNPVLINSNSKVVILTDSNVQLHCLPLFKRLNVYYEVIVLNAGEVNKNIDSLQLILEKLFNFGMSKNDLLVNLGGGVISDIGGLAAALYKRGLNYINIPTTLMGMIDAAHGGKTAINFNEIKNSLGLFYKPLKTYIYTPFLQTLPTDEIKNGFGEIIKYGIIAGGELFNEISSITDINDLYKNKSLITKCIDIKLSIVEKDFFDIGARKVLNLGHTIGHALESINEDLNQSHGFYVAHGIAIESIISFKKGLLSEGDLDSILVLVFRFFNKPKECNIEHIWQKCMHDKKNTNQVIASLPLGIGNVSEGIEITKLELNEAFFFYNGFY